LVFARPLRTAGSAALATALLLALLRSDAIRDGADRVGGAEGCGGVASLPREACIGGASMPIAACSSLLASDRRAPTSAALLAVEAINGRADDLMM
tara:strand:+ start:575 stop:862 length:288 start_codon:yes stop_codon:yes gene_type:complete